MAISPRHLPWEPLFRALWLLRGRDGNSYFQASGPGQPAILFDPVQEVGPSSLPGPAAGLCLVTTHLQREHVAGVANFPGASLWVPAGDEYLCAGEEAYRGGLTVWEAPWDWETRGCFRGQVAGARNERPPIHPLQVAGTLRDGQCWHGWQILATPGHGKHALTFVREFSEGRVAVCGDLIYGAGQMWNWYDCEWDYGLQRGPKAVAASCERLLQAGPSGLLPAHGAPVRDGSSALHTLVHRLGPILRGNTEFNNPTNFAEPAEELPGWRRLSPHLYQWKTGNCALLVSGSGHGLLVDDGLCHWVPPKERRRHHHEVMEQLKMHLGLHSIEWVLVTHFHGDHTENIPEVRAREGTRVATMACVAGPMEHPEQYNLAAALPWYGTETGSIAVDRVLRQDELLTWREYQISAFHLGGQTYHHAGFEVVVDSHRVCFVGDAIGGTGRACEPVLCYNDAEPRTRGWAYAIGVLLSRDADLLVCGHGAALWQPREILRAKARAWEEMLHHYTQLNPHEDLRAFFDPFLPPPSNMLPEPG